jgi:hypothetical protein
VFFGNLVKALISFSSSFLIRQDRYRVRLKKNFQVVSFHQDAPTDSLCSQLPAPNRQAYRLSAKAGRFGSLFHG